MDSKIEEKFSKKVTKANRKDISDPVVKKLFALSGNQCAMPGCEVRLVYEELEAVKGIICHIEAASEGVRGTILNKVKCKGINLKMW